MTTHEPKEPNMPSARSATPRIPRRGSLPSTRQTKRDLNDRSRAQALVEFVLIVPVLLLLLLMAIDFGRLFFSYVQVSNASREAASYGAVYPSDTATMTTYAQREANVQAQAGEHTLSLTTTCADSGGTAIACTAAAGGSGLGNSLTIKVTEQFTFLTPLISAFFGGHVDIASTSTTAVLGLAPNGGVTPPSGCGVPTSAAFIVTVSTLTVTLDASAALPNAGSCAISSYDWDMGDGLDPFPPVVGKTTTYTYAGAGTYPIKLTVSNPGGELFSTQFIAVGVVPTPSPSASASASPTPSPVPTPVPTATPAPTPSPSPACATVPDFTWQSDNKNNPTITFQGSYTGQPAPLTWSWDWTNNGSIDDTGQAQSNKYNGNPTNVTVKLIVQNGSCGPFSVTHVVIP